jgi:hypothetical protein
MNQIIPSYSENLSPEKNVGSQKLVGDMKERQCQLREEKIGKKKGTHTQQRSDG